MELFLMRHGFSNPSDKDPEEGLTQDGIDMIKKIASSLKKININFDIILTSPKKRAIQTAEIVAKEFSFPKEHIIETDKLYPLTPAEETLDFLSNFKEYKSFFIAGHLPSIKEIISYLLFPTSSIEIDVFHGACTKIKIEDHRGILVWHLVPEIFKLIK